MCFVLDLSQLTWVKEGRKALCMTLCSAASSKLDTISSAHILLRIIKHLSEIALSAMRYMLSRMLISLHRLSKFLFIAWFLYL